MSGDVGSTGAAVPRASGTPRLRRATAADRQAVERLLTEADLPIAGVADVLDHFVVAEGEGGDLVGVAGLEVHGPDGVLRSVAVAPRARGGGLGARLTDRIVEAARRAGLRSLWLLTTTAEDWFPRHGFRRARRDAAPPGVRDSVEFREACPASAVAMVLPLEEGEAP